MKVFDTIKKGLRKIARTLGKVCLVIMATVTQTDIGYENTKKGNKFYVSMDRPVPTTCGLVVIGNVALAIWKNSPIVSGISAGLSLALITIVALAEKSKRKDEHENKKDESKDEHEHEKEMKMLEHEHEKEMKMLEYEHEKEMHDMLK